MSGRASNSSSMAAIDEHVVQLSTQPSQHSLTPPFQENVPSPKADAASKHASNGDLDVALQRLNILVFPLAPTTCAVL